MSAANNKSPDYKPLGNSSAKNGGSDSQRLNTLTPRGLQRDSPLQNLSNAHKQEISSEQTFLQEKTVSAEFPVSLIEKESIPEEYLDFAEQQKKQKSEKKSEKDFKLLKDDNWLTRNGHGLTFFGVYLFSVLVFFRPYELIPGLGFLSSSAFIVALTTLLIYLPTQLSTEGNLTVLSTEVKAILALTLIAVVTMPIAKNPGMAWESLNDIYIKAVLIFIVMVNVIRTRRRLTALMNISFAIAVYLSINALYLYAKGEFHVEDYRVSADVKGLFENPNEMALHLVMMIPIVFTLGLSSKKILPRIIYFAVAALLTGANFVTFSRGGFLGLIAAAGVLVWKLGRKNRLKVTLSSLFIGLLVIVAAPGNYGVRILSIFGLAADPVGSSDQRRELLIRSLLVSARNPWGIGMGNFPLVSIHMLVTHNAFTQVSSELGILGLAAYLIFMVSPFRKLGAIERTEFAAEKSSWFYYLAIGLQASLVAYWVSSFFAAVAYNWFIYYLIAYAVAFRRVYQLENGLKEEVKPAPLWDWQAA